MDTTTSPPIGSSAWFSAVYDVLVEHLQAHESMALRFITLHTAKSPCDEFRLDTRLGFGGKYRRKTNTVDCYPEDETPGRLALIAETNAALAALND